MYKSSLNTIFKQFKIISCFFKLNLLLQLFFKYESCHEHSIYRMFWTFYKPDLTFFFHGPMNSVHSIKVFQQIHYYHNQHIWKAVSWLCDFSSSFWWNLVLHLFFPFMNQGKFNLWFLGNLVSQMAHLKDFSSSRILSMCKFCKAFECPVRDKSFKGNDEGDRPFICQIC